MYRFAIRPAAAVSRAWSVPATAARAVAAVPVQQRSFAHTTPRALEKANVAVNRDATTAASAAASSPAAAAKPADPAATAAAPKPKAKPSAKPKEAEPGNEPWRRDHRSIGQMQKLFNFHDLSPGSAFFLPHGTHIVYRLMDLMRTQYRRFGFSEVITPLLYKRPLWQASGHWDNYKDDMFTVLPGQGDQAAPAAPAPVPAPAKAEAPAAAVEAPEDAAAVKWESHEGCAHHAHHAEPAAAAADAEAGLYGLKPMNCPGHCLLFKSTRHSYKDLPLRIADFSPLHRNEASGALSGLTRVRRFHQDDAHIFCTRDQIAAEMTATLRMIDEVYTLFGFTSWEFALSTRPDKFIGSVAEWDAAEATLRGVLDQHGRAWRENPGDGAFYGPKIDVRVQDAAGRSHQTATVQLDFQLPQRFGLEYENADNSVDRPVMIHRAVLGSVERMFAILAEHYRGHWPFWLSPRHAVVIPIHHKRPQLLEYAQKVRDLLSGAAVDATRLIPSRGERWSRAMHAELSALDATHAPLTVDVDLSTHTLKHKIRAAQDAGYNFILLVGDAELEARSVSVRPAFDQARELAFVKFDIFPQKARGTRNVPLDELQDMFELLGAPYIRAQLDGAGKAKAAAAVESARQQQ
ncbi:threonyl-tRNA synthetase [Blastocladiella emersonii ATCC 22665]|nr:threonyl-tRNA synthetase [Blastocladiella emersonii ATCC 22665]